MRQTLRESGPAFRNIRGRGARAAALGTAPANTVETRIPLDTIQWDAIGAYSAAAGNEGFIVPVSGFYDISGSVGWAANATGARRATIGAGNYTAQPEIQAVASGGDITICNGVLTNVLLIAGQLIYLACYQVSGGSLNIYPAAGYNWLSWALVRPL